jgi:hypothetical protein
VVGKGWDDMLTSRREWEIGDVQFGIMSRMHDAVIGIANRNRINSNSLVDDGVFDADEGGGSACISKEPCWLRWNGWRGRTTTIYINRSRRVR